MVRMLATARPSDGAARATDCEYFCWMTGHLYLGYLSCAGFQDPWIFTTGQRTNAACEREGGLICAFETTVICLAGNCCSKFYCGQVVHYCLWIELAVPRRSGYPGLSCRPVTVTSEHPF